MFSFIFQARERFNFTHKASIDQPLEIVIDGQPVQ